MKGVSEVKKLLAYILVLCNICSVTVSASGQDEFLIPGDYVEFGKLYGEPILWRVVDHNDNGYLLFSEKIVEVRSFDAATDTVREDLYRQTHGSNYWGTSSLRDWLNSEEQKTEFKNAVPNESHVLNGKNSYDSDSGFLYEFTDGEKNIINSVNNKSYLSYVDCYEIFGGSEVISYGADISDTGNDAFYMESNDKVFILDRDELYKNVLLRGYSYDKEYTAEALSRERSNSLINFWTRTPQGDNSSNVFVYEKDDEYYVNSYNAYNSEIGIVPALYVKSGRVLSGQGTIGNPYVLDTENTEDVDIEAYAQRLTEKAEKSKLQIDIDEAQTAVSKLLDGENKISLMNRLDNLQLKANYALFQDYSEYNDGDSFQCGNNAMGSIVNDNGNLIAKVSLTADKISGWGQLHDFVKNIPDKNYSVLQKFKYSGNITDGRIIIYAKPYNDHVFQIYTDQGTVINSNFNVVSSDMIIAPDKWYVVQCNVNVENNKYEIIVTNDETGANVFTSGEYDYNYNHGMWTGLQYIFEGKSHDSSGVYYVDDIAAWFEDEMSEIRNAVVKAERSLLKTDIEKALSLVNTLEDGYEKIIFAERLQDITQYGEAAQAVETAITTGFADDIISAQAQIDKLDEGNEKKIIQARLTKVNPVSSYDKALMLVNKAEQSTLQSDIDMAQISVSQLTQNAETKALENRLDLLQKKLDSLMYVDFSDKYDGQEEYFANRTYGSYVKEDTNMVAKIELSQYSASGWGPAYNFDFSLPSSFKIEQKIKYTGNVENGRFLLYANDGVCHLYNAYIDNKSVINSSWSEASHDILSENKWYNIIYNVNDDKYYISVVDVQSGETVYTGGEYTLEYDLSAWKQLQYRFEGKTSDNSGMIYVDDLVVVPYTDLIKARELVVKAERSKSDEDIQSAYEAVLKLSGEDFESLSGRVDNIQKIVLNAMVINSDNDLKVIADVTTGSNEPINVKVVMALYDGNHLSSCNISESKTITANDRVSATFEIEPNKDYTVKVFLLNDLNDLKPIINPYVWK